MTRTSYIRATGDGRRNVDGVAVVGSYQSVPPTPRPYKVRGVAFTPRTERTVEIALTEAEARKLVRDWHSFGLSDA